MVKNSFKVFIAILICLIFSCRNSELEYKEYLKYLADKDNGLVKEASAGGVKVKVKYLPTDYLIYKAAHNSDSVASKAQIENLHKEYENSLTFILTLGPADGESFSITRVGINSYEEFAQRIETMSFNMKEYISLVVGDKEYKPDLIQLESINSLEQSKNIIVVFNTVDKAGVNIMQDDLVFIYNDELFLTGVNKFKFKKSDLVHIPGLNNK